MNVSYDIVSTLRANMKHHEPIVLIYDARGNGGGYDMPDAHRRSPEQGDGLHGPGRDGQPIIFRDEQTIKLNGGRCLFHSLQRPQERAMRTDMETLTFNQQRYAEYAEDEIAVTLRSSFGDYGGGSEVLVLESNQNHATVQDTEICPTLPASMGLGGVMCL